MKVIIRSLIMLTALFASAACTEENKSASASDNVLPSLAALPNVPASTSDVKSDNAEPEAAITGFYQALAAKDCEKAKVFRPAYTVSQCNRVEKTTLNSTRIELNTGEKAAAYLNFTYLANGAPHEFVGFLWLKKNAGQWQIQENFVPLDKMGSDKFISTYIKDEVATPSPAVQAQVKDVIEGGDHKTLLADLRKRFNRDADKIVILIDVSQQKLFVYDEDNQKVGNYRISTATKGAGNTSGSDKTPLGAHRISEKIGDGAKVGSIFISRNNTGQLANIEKAPVDVPEDQVTTRILWLDGLEPGKNKGGNVDSHSRYIYIHGTPEEGLIGKPASHGCIRMINEDVVKIFNQSPENTLVYIGE